MKTYNDKKFVKAISRYGTAVYLMLIWLALPSYGSTLKELQQTAVNNRKIIEKYQVAMEQARLDGKIAGSLFLPSLDINYTANRLAKDSLFENSENSGLTSSLSWNIFAGFRDRYRVESADLIRKVRLFELESLIQDIKYNVALKYLDIYDKINRLNVAREEYNLLSRRYEDAENRHSVGLIRRNDLLKIQVDLDDAQQKLETAKAEYSKSLNIMASIIDASLDGVTLDFTIFEQHPDLPDLEVLQSRIYRRSEIKALETLVMAGESSVKASQSEFYPSVDMIAVYRVFGDDFFAGATKDTNDELRLQLAIRMNLYDGGRKYAVIRKAKADVMKINSDIYELKQQFSAALKNTLIEYEVTLKNLQVAESGISLAEQNLRITDISFREGVETATDVLSAIFNLSRAKYNRLNAKTALFMNYFSLLRMIDDL